MAPNIRASVWKASYSFDVALGLPLAALLQHLADRVVVIHHICDADVALVRLSQPAARRPGPRAVPVAAALPTRGPGSGGPPARGAARPRPALRRSADLRLGGRPLRRLGRRPV